MGEASKPVNGLIDAARWRGAETQLVRLVTELSRPTALRKLQLGLLVAILLWSASSLAQLFWVVWPTPAPEPIDGKIINPATSSGAASVSREPISLEGALGLGLFGNPEADAEAVAEAAGSLTDSTRDGIEDGAQETRLALRLTGIVASTEDGLGSAVIEARNVEQTFAVGDALPVGGDVTLAKVMATQVVINNGGTYELLKLFEDNVLEGVIRATAPPPVTEISAASSSQAAQAAVRPENREEAARIATDVRRQLYDDPQSLAQLVSVAAVRDESGLRGYRVAPGANPSQFRQLGFQPGDVITSVNGLSLSDPANTVRLYQMMRDATDATFEIERAGGATSLTVSLGALP